MARDVRLLPRLLVLWLLAEQPQHGYAIKRALSGPGLAYWLPIDEASIYAALRALQTNGWARALRPEQPGARPARTRYAITPAGRREYARLLQHALAQPEPAHGLLPLALAAAPDLEPGVLEAGLVARVAALEARRAYLDAHARALPSALMRTRELALIEAELAWCAHTLSELRRA